MIPLNDANGIANSEDPDQTASLGAVLSGCALFARLVSSKLRKTFVDLFIRMPTRQTNRLSENSDLNQSYVKSE